MRVRLLAAGVVAAGLLSACGASETPAPDPETSSPTSPASQHGGYAACLAEQGVPTPPMGPGAPPGVDAGTWEKASAACADLQPGPAA